VTTEDSVTGHESVCSLCKNQGGTAEDLAPSSLVKLGMMALFLRLLRCKLIFTLFSYSNYIFKKGTQEMFLPAAGVGKAKPIPLLFKLL
jgi:hypothetical protein